MITYEDLHKLVSSGLLPDPEEADLWWSLHGVSRPDLVRFCADDAENTLTTTIPIVLQETYGVNGFPLDDLPALMGSVAAMHMEVGFLLGWLAYELHTKGGPIEL